MASPTFGKIVIDWELIDKSIVGNSAELGFLEADRLELQTIRVETVELGNQLDVLKAQRQQVRQNIKDKLRQGESVAAKLRSGIRAKYGYKSEKLTEFLLQPFRRRTRGVGV